jgi:hypothetical protein
MSRTWMCLAAALFLGFPALAHADVKEFKGQITDDDPKDPVRQFPCKIHEVKLPKGQQCQLDLMSEDFDCYLRLVDSTGKEVANDDDGGEKLNSRIRYIPTSDEPFKVYVTTFAGGTGNYLLKVTTPDVAKGGAGGGAAPAVVLDVEGNIQAGGDTDPSTGKPAKLYEVKLKKGVYQVDMMSKDIDSYLRVFDEGGKQIASDDDGGERLNSRLKLNIDKDSTVKIYATTFGGDEGPYKLIVKSLGGGGPAKADGKGVALAAPTADKATDYNGEIKANDPLDVVRRKPAVTHFVELKAGKTYEINLNSQWDNYLRLEDAAGKQLAQDDDSGGFPNARIIFNCPADGRYRVIATSFAGGTGAYSLRINEQ